MDPIGEMNQKDKYYMFSPICRIFFFFFFFFLGLYPQLMQVPRLGVKLELQPLVYTTATATPDLTCICDLYHSSWQRKILSPLIKARDQTLVLMDTNQVCYC